MVYLGRPSQGCLTCQARRIKCDQTRPTCNRCQKSKRKCGGYRYEWDGQKPQLPMMMKKNHQALPVASFPSNEGERTVNNHESASYHHQQQQQKYPSPPRTPPIPLTERATCHFASNFILVPHNPAASPAQSGFLSHLASLIESASDDSPIRSAFNACALGLMSNLEKADNVNLTNLTLREHTLALGRTHAALANPATATSDSTIATVHLLCLFESITAVKAPVLLAWKTHLQGLVNIVRARGREQLRSTRVGTMLFNIIRVQLISCALVQGSGPPMGIDWWMAGSETDTDPVTAICHRFAFRTAELRGEVIRTMERATAAPEAARASIKKEITSLLQRVQDLDGAIASFLDNKSTGPLPFRTVTWISDTGDPRFSGNHTESEVYPGRIDVYPDVITAGVWHTARGSRLFLASMAVQLIEYLHSSSAVDIDIGDRLAAAPEYVTIRHNCEAIISDIIASVPILLGWRPPAGLSYYHAHTPKCPETCAYTDLEAIRSIMGQSHVGFACGSHNNALSRFTAPPVTTGLLAAGSGEPEQPTTTLGGLFVSWPLATIKDHEFASPTQREWAAARLIWIDRHAGLRYAGVMGQVSYFLKCSIKTV